MNLLATAHYWLVLVLADNYREQLNIGNDGQPRPNFCAITVEVPSDSEVEVSMRGNIPLSPSVREWIDSHGLKLRNQLGQYLRFTVRMGEQRMLDDLALRIKAITAPGTSYSEPSYKYVCPQVESCLILLREKLDKAWGAAT